MSASASHRRRRRRRLQHESTPPHRIIASNTMITRRLSSSSARAAAAAADADAIGAATVWGPWDASHPTPKIVGTKCIWHPNFCNWLVFSLQRRQPNKFPPNLLAVFRGAGVRKGIDGTGGVIVGDGEGTEEEKEGDRHPPH